MASNKQQQFHTDNDIAPAIRTTTMVPNDLHSFFLGCENFVEERVGA
jgi:hypothetical protein